LGTGAVTIDTTSTLQHGSDDLDGAGAPARDSTDTKQLP
jgi:hypothetical protein